MSHLSVGQKLPDFSCPTPFWNNVRISEAVRNVGGKTAILFLRYYGCRLCQLDLLEYTEEYEKIAKKNAQLFIVLQSDPEKLRSQFKKSDIPFEVLCDPEQKIYKLLDIRPATSKETMSDTSGAAKMMRMEARNLVHGEYEGNELQLPAAFVINHDMTIAYVRYGRVITDVPTPEDLAELL